MARTPRAGALRAPCLALIAFAAFAISTLASTARAQTLLDNFNDNSLSAADWTSYATSPSTVLAEKNSHLEFSTLSTPLIASNTWNHAEISSTWGIGTKANIQVKMDVNFVAQVGSANSTANTGLMILFSPIDNVASSNGIADGFGLQIGSELISNYNFRKIAVVGIRNGQPYELKAFYNNYGNNTFYDPSSMVNPFTLTPGATVYVSYLVATRTLQFGTETNTPFFSQTVANASDSWVTSQRPVRLSLGGYALGPTKPLSASSIDNVMLQQGVQSYRPTNCEAADGISTIGIALTWNEAASASSYNIYRSVNGGLAYLITNTPSTSYTDVPSSSNILVAGVNYTYVVRAVSTAGDSESSNADVGWFNIGPATGLSATDGTLTTGVKLTWTAPIAPSAIIGYKVMRAIGSAAASKIGSSSVTNYLDTTAVAGTVYTYSIIAATGAGDSLTASNTDIGWRFIGVPTIKTVSPASGPIAGGTPFTITGTNLTGATSVKVNGVAATSVVVVSPTSITAISPTGTTGSTNVVADVVVETLGGTVTKVSAFTFAAAPTLTTVSPDSGPLAAGTAITITGTNFIAGATVKVNGVAATSVVVVSATSITAKTPAGTEGSCSVAVTTVGGMATLESGFTYVAKPTITSIAPTSGTTLGGTAFTITGTNLTGATSVKVNGVAATSVDVVNATTITAVTPAGTAGAKSVAVTTVGGTFTKASAFTYIAAPTIKTVSPASGPIAGGTALKITGTNFIAGATSVKVNGVAATSVVVVSPTSITAISPTGTTGSTNVVADVVVETLGGTVTKVSAFTFAAAPTLTTVSPDSGPLAAGTAITITGTNFIAGATVKVNGVAATSVVVVSATSITAKTPAGTAGARSVAVTTVGGTETLESGFTYVAKPTIASISPTSGSTSGDTEITITGTNFVVGATVKVNGVAATSVVVVSATSITAVTPAGTVGAKSVAVTTAGGTATKTKAFTYISSFTGDGTDSSGSGTGGDGRATATKTNGADASDAQATTDPAAETIVAAPMGVELYLQTIITQPDMDVDCVHTQSSDANAPDATTVTVAAIDLDHNGEADICQLRGGDLDLNGVIDDADMSILLDMIGTKPLHGIGDLDGNGVIDSADMSLLLLKVE